MRPPTPPPEPSIQTPDGPPRFVALCRTLLSMEVPAGYRAEVIGGNIVMSPWSKGYYFPVMEAIREQLTHHIPRGCVFGDAPFLFTFPETERAYGPDLYVAARKAFRTTRRYIDGEALTLVGELTSPSTRADDWHDKPTVYGRCGIPVYLLLDMQEQSATVFWEPSELGYASRTTVRIGKTLHIPAPFDCDLDTSDFHPPAGDDEDEAG